MRYTDTNLHVLQVIGLLLLSACCGARLNYDTFRSLPLSDQLAAYEKARHENCVREGSAGFLDLIALHGYEAADSVVALVRRPNPSFPLDDAITILEFVHFRGYDLRQHEALHLLEDLAKTSSDPAVRQEAATAVQRITKNDPLIGVERPGG